MHKRDVNDNGHVTLDIYATRKQGLWDPFGTSFLELLVATNDWVDSVCGR